MKLPAALCRSLLAVYLSVSAFGQSGQQQTPLPEQAEFAAIRSITDINERIKELKRLRAAYPESSLLANINSTLLQAVSLNPDTKNLDKLLADQKEIISQCKVESRFMMMVNSANYIFNHPNVDDFSKPAVLKAVQEYKTEAMPLLSNPEFIASLWEGRRALWLDSYQHIFEIPIAKAQMLNGNGQAALNTMEERGKKGNIDTFYYIALGEVYSNINRDKEALEAFITALIDGNPAARDGAQRMYARINSGEAGFDAFLKNRQTQLPFHPPTFRAPESWQGKAVLAELFTGSECPPCVAADFAFDGLIESYPTKHLVILEYHLPIPLYDPMMNAATNARQDYYKDMFRGTPTSIIDGVHSVTAGGARASSPDSYNKLKEAIDPLMDGTAPVIINARAELSGDTVRVHCEFSKAMEDADYNVVLVQEQHEFAGSNGIIYHKMVVRDIETVSPAASATIIFNIPNAEKTADEHIAAWGKATPQSRMNGTKWPETQSKIDRNNLKAVVFVQDKTTKEVYNAHVVDVMR